MINAAIDNALDGLVNNLSITPPSRARGLSSSQTYQTGKVNFPLSQTARARTREDWKNWRVKTFGGDYDPVAAAVDDAVKAFSRKDPAQDRRIWLKIANRVGYEAFLEVFFEQQSKMRDAEVRGRPLRCPASAFQNALNRRFPKGGAQ